MILDKHENDKVVGEIYKITNNANEKIYIGQTRSHRLNHGKYRPFGYLGRLKDHIHEANSSKKTQCSYLNSAIRKYGEENFTCEKIHTCLVSELDDQEKYFITKFDSKFPNGYNLTDGGKGFTHVKGEYTWRTSIPPQQKSLPQPKSDYTKKLISERLKTFYDDASHRENRSKLTQKQHLSKKYELFKNVIIDDNQIDSYIRVVRNNTNNSEYVRIVINKIRATFVGKSDTTEVLKNRARQFILNLQEWQRNQIAGNPLEPLATTS